ncbi:M48 family metallopeptidase [Nocardioides campestrisoli]|uniref:M48 family metallopeptidase n=1 Tax=Nocardioides campestrisoli TaxID=2736757 RepID=UPI0015E64736|nr:M48 family metallopeptidase [Nocardioides campestrisoli]
MPSPSSSRLVAGCVLVVSGTAFVVLAWLLVPWQPVPGGVPDPVDPSALFSAAEIDRAEAYSARARAWSWSSLALTLILLSVAALVPGVRRGIARLPGPWWVQTYLGVCLLLLAVRLITLPLAVGAWRLRRENGLSTQNWSTWAADLARSEALETGTFALVVLLLVAFARRWQVWWPALAATTLGLLVAGASLAYPLVVEPVFNDFEPLPDGPLREAVTEVAAAQGVSVEDVVVADASRRTTTLNAWVSGLGGTRRVVLYDNLVDQVPQDQVMTVVAHELAHARHGDVLTGTALGVAGVGVGVGLLGLCWPSRARTRISDVRAVPALVVVLVLGMQLASPVQNAISRRLELRADVEALAATGDPESFVELQRQLAVRSLSDPTPPAWSSWWWGSHPGVLTRVALAR